MTWLGAVITSYLNKKIKDKKLANLASNLVMIVMNSVQAVTQEYVSVMKKNGKWTEEAQAEAKQRAYTIICSQLTPELREYITTNFGDIKSYIFTQIEAIIYQLKK